ncbi:MAG: type II toxin-antitoxin system HipA family toxin YjjJ [Anaeromyxobacter sp.]
MAVARSEFLEALGFTGLASSAALRGQLGISSATLMRVADALGDEVIRVGRARATQYARTRRIEGLGRSLPVFKVDELGAPTQAGKLHLLWAGRTYWERAAPARGVLFEGLPPALADMAPQGYMGRAFGLRHAEELGLPQRILDWSDEHRLIALARRGEDCVGDLIVGDESLRRFLAQAPPEVDPDRFPELARRSAFEDVGSSAGGERPKIGVFSGGRHVLVKFSPDADTPAARRWADLLWCEWHALETIRAAGRTAARARCLDVAGWRFLEVERFDRVGRLGRRAVLSLLALVNEYGGNLDSWTAAALAFRGRPFLLPEDDATALRWLDVFGNLIGNTDRHFGNVSFLVGDDLRLRLAPAYDTLPMILAPSGDEVFSRELRPSPPTAATLDIWPDAAAWALRYWRGVRENEGLGQEVRSFAERALGAVSSLAERVAPRG